MKHGSITIGYMQHYIREKQNQRDNYEPRKMYIKLSEEMGELARVMIRGEKHAPSAEELKGTVEEELCDVLYYTLKLANTLGVELEDWIPLKEQLNSARYPCGIDFDPEGDLADDREEEKTEE